MLDLKSVGKRQVVRWWWLEMNETKRRRMWDEVVCGAVALILSAAMGLLLLAVGKQAGL